MSILGDRIKKERENLNLTREDLAKKIGVSYSAIAMYERGEREPNNEITIKLCELFNCSVDYLIGLIPYETLKEDLEKELYKFDLTEDEFHDALNCFMHDSKQIQSLAFTLSFLPNSKNEEINREKKILKTILKYVLEFIPDELRLPRYETTKLEDRENIREEFYRNFDKALRTAKKMLLSLDKSKIIHNYKNDFSNNKFHMCPVYGKISAGIPNWAEECLEGYLPIDPNLFGIVNPDECFFLIVNGQSMNKVIRNGAYALIRKQDTVENGEICAVLVNGFEATLKKFSKQGDLVILEPMSDDPSFTTQVYNKETQIRIIGKYIGKFEMNK